MNAKGAANGAGHMIHVTAGLTEVKHFHTVGHGCQFVWGQRDASHMCQGLNPGHHQCRAAAQACLHRQIDMACNGPAATHVPPCLQSFVQSRPQEICGARAGLRLGRDGLVNMTLPREIQGGRGEAPEAAGLGFNYQPAAQRNGRRNHRQSQVILMLPKQTHPSGRKRHEWGNVAHERRCKNNTAPAARPETTNNTAALAPWPYSSDPVAIKAS